MKKYEYKVISKGTHAALNDKKIAEMRFEMENELNKLGLEGWELIQWKNNMLIFKREMV